MSARIANDVLSQVRRAFQDSDPRTIQQVTRDLGMKRSSVCWCVHKLSGEIQKVRVGICPVSRNRATFYTTNPDVASNYHIANTKDIWRHLDYDSTERVWMVITDYVQSGYNDSSLCVPGNLTDVWQKVKEIIDREVAI